MQLPDPLALTQLAPPERTCPRNLGPCVLPGGEPFVLRVRQVNSTGHKQRSGDTSLAITGMRTVGVPVTDQDRAVEFYVNTLGFEKRLDAPSAGSAGAGSRWRTTTATPTPEVA